MKHTLIVNNIKQQKKSVYYPYLSGWRLAGIRRKMKNTVAHSHTRRTVRSHVSFSFMCSFPILIGLIKTHSQLTHMLYETAVLPSGAPGSVYY